MTMPRLQDYETSRWRSRVEGLERTVSDLERKVEQLTRKTERAAFDTEMELSSQKSNFQLLVFALINVAVIALVIVRR